MTNDHVIALVAFRNKLCFKRFGAFCYIIEPQFSKQYINLQLFEQLCLLKNQNKQYCLYKIDAHTVYFYSFEAIIVQATSKASKAKNYWESIVNKTNQIDVLNNPSFGILWEQ